MALTDNLVAYWRLDEASGTRADSSGNARSLTANGSPVSRTGKLGNAADFVPGSSQYLSTADATVSGTIVGTSGWTIAGWVYSDDNATRGLCTTFTTVGSSGLQALFHASYLVARDVAILWYNNAGSATIAASGASMTSGAWNFWAIKFDPADGKVRVRTNATTGTGVTASGTFTTHGDFALGRDRPAGGPTYFDGGIDDVGLWSRALSGAELDQLYNSGAGLDPTASTGSALPLFAAQLMAMR